MTVGVEDRFETLSGLGHRVRTWAQVPATPGPSFLLLHGFLDQGDSFDAIARALVGGSGATVTALDFRGHGHSDWIGAGGYYHFPDYVRDVRELVDRSPSLRAPFVLAGHSMGGTVATYAAAVMPGRLRGLVLLEGTGPPGVQPEDAPERTRMWLSSLERHRSHVPRALADLDAAVERLRSRFPELSEAICRDFAERTTIASERGVRWRHDPLHRTLSPAPFLAATFEAFASEVTVPTLLVHGETSEFFRADHPETQRRIAAFRGPRTIAKVAGAGHMLHLSHAEAVARAILAWL